ncbi:MAG: FixH family protein [Paracoccus sp. (in: a-proteobacteria)]|nr:FixH family protein [Paracoccus sp. (in: a-proteobacteria)]
MKRELTGRHVLAIALGAFGVTIIVNLVMAYHAIGTFSGLETRSSYIASQHFDRDRTAQQQLGWQADLRIEGSRAVLRLTDERGAAVTPRELSLLLRRPTSQRDDVTPLLNPEAPGRFSAAVVLAPGNWNADIAATAADGTAFRQRIKLHVPASGGRDG